MSESKVQYKSSTKIVQYILSEGYAATCTTHRGESCVHMKLRIMRQDHPELYLVVFATAFPVQNKDEMTMAHNTVQKILHDPSTYNCFKEIYES